MNKYSGSNFDDFLEEEDLLEEVSDRTQKRLLALQIEESIIKATNLSKTETLQLNHHLFDPENTSVTLESLNRLRQMAGLANRPASVEFSR